MDENKELPPSSFLSASVWLPASPSFLLLVRFFYWPACFFLYGRLFHWTDFYRPSHLINRIDVCQKYSWGFYLASDIFDGVSSSLTSCVLKKVFLHWISKKETKWKERAPSQNSAHIPFTLVKKNNQPNKQTKRDQTSDPKDTWRDTQAGQKSTLVLSSLLAGSNPPLMGPAPSSCSSHGLAGVFSPFLEGGCFKMLQRKSINECFGQNLWSS